MKCPNCGYETTQTRAEELIEEIRQRQKTYAPPEPEPKPEPKTTKPRKHKLPEIYPLKARIPAPNYYKLCKIKRALGDSGGITNKGKYSEITVNNLRTKKAIDKLLFFVAWGKRYQYDFKEEA